MSEAYKKFLEEYQKIPVEKEQTQVCFVMDTLADMAEEKRFEEFQAILDDADPELFRDAAFTIALVAWWHGDKLDRKEYIKRGIAYFDKLKGKGYGNKVFKGVCDGKWEPLFGGDWERKLFGISE